MNFSRYNRRIISILGLILILVPILSGFSAHTLALSSTGFAVLQGQNNTLAPRTRFSSNFEVDIFKPILGVIEPEQLSRINIEIALIMNMVLKGIDNGTRYKSHLNINTALDQLYEKYENRSKILELVESPSIFEGGPIILKIRAKGIDSQDYMIKVIFNGRILDEFYNQKKTKLILLSDQENRKKAFERIEPPRSIPYDIEYPIKILTDEEITLENSTDRNFLRERLKSNIYYANAPPERQEQIMERTMNFTIIVPYIENYMQKKYPELEILNISFHGMYPYGEDEDITRDVDLLVIVRGRFFNQRTEIIKVDIDKLPFKNLIRSVPKLCLSIRGEDNFKYGLVEETSPVADEYQLSLIERTIPVVYKRNIVLKGFDFKDNFPVLEKNVLAKVSALLNNAYEYIYRFNRYRPIPVSHRKAPTRLYLASILLKELYPDIDINCEEMLNLRLRVKNGEISGKEIEKAWMKMNSEFEKICSTIKQKAVSLRRGSIIESSIDSSYEFMKTTFSAIEQNPVSSETADEGLISVMEQRFSMLKEKFVKGVILDVDKNITGQDGRIHPAIIEMIVFMRESGIPVMFNTERVYRWIGPTKNTDVDMETVLKDIRGYLLMKNIPEEKQREILRELYIATEGGLIISNGFLRGENNFQVYDEQFFKTVGIIIDPEREEKLKGFLLKIDLEKYELSCDMKLAKERSFSFFDHGEGKEKRLTDLAAALPGILNAAGLYDGNIKIFIRRTRVIVTYYPVEKDIGLNFFDKYLGLVNDDESVIITIGDSGQKGGNDHSMLTRIGGLSSDEYDPEDPNMIALPLISGKRPSFQNVLWALRKLTFRSEKKESYEKNISVSYHRGILKKAGMRLKGYPIDMVIDLSLIPEEDLEANMCIWSDIIALHKKYELNINYIFNSGNGEYIEKAKKVLLKQIENNILFSDIEKTEVRDRINEVHPENGKNIKIIIHIMKVDDLRKIKSFPRNMYPIAMSEGHLVEGVPLRDFASAASIGLVEAICFRMKMEDEESLPLYLEKEVLPLMRRIYSRLFPDDKINDLVTKETIMNMINGSSIVRKNLAIHLALPPITRMAVSQLEVYHDKMHYLLQSA